VSESSHAEARRLRLWLKDHPGVGQEDMRNAGFLRCSAQLRKLNKHGLVKLKHNERGQEIWFFQDYNEPRKVWLDDWQNWNLRTPGKPPE
jgi:hypothetical protein